MSCLYLRYGLTTLSLNKYKYCSVFHVYFHPFHITYHIKSMWQFSKSEKVNKKYRNIKNIYLQDVSAIRPSSVELRFEIYINLA